MLHQTALIMLESFELLFKSLIFCYPAVIIKHDRYFIHKFQPNFFEIFHCLFIFTIFFCLIYSSTTGLMHFNRPFKWRSIFMPPPLGAGGIMFSGRPSVRSINYPLSTRTWVRWSIRPTVTVLRHVRPSVRPSVRPERFPGICRRTHGGNGLQFCMLMYLDHLHKLLVYCRGLLIFLNFGSILTYWNRSNLEFPGISRRTQ